MSDAAMKTRESLKAPGSFSLQVVGGRSVLSAMRRVRDNYGENFAHFEAFMKARGEDVSLGAVHDYFAALNTEACAASTKRIRRQAVKARLRKVIRSLDLNEQARFDQAMKELDRDPETKAPKVQAAPVGMEKVIARDSFDALCARSSARTRLFEQFLYRTGCRVSELTGIRLEDCEDLGGAVKVRILGKGSKERFVRIRAALFEEIRATFAGTTYLFETSSGRPYTRKYVSGEIAKAGRRALGRKISAHTMRHSFATLTIRRTNKVQAVSTYLGHSSPSITLGMYVHEQLTDDELFDPEQ
jgi:integrase/recombinase XerD